MLDADTVAETVLKVLLPEYTYLFPDKSVTLPECTYNTYVVPLVRLLLGVIVKVLPLMEVVVDMFFPELLIRSIHPVPFLMDSLNVTLIALLTAMFVALFVGSVLFMVGAVLSVLKVLLPEYTYLFPDKSVILPECTYNTYVVPLVRLLLGVMVNMLLLMLVVIATDFPLLVFSSIHPVPFLMDSLNVTLIALLTAMFVALFVGSVLLTVGAVKSAVAFFVAFAVVVAADTLHKLSDAMLKTIATAKNNFILILPPPNPKTTPTIFNNLNIKFPKFKKSF